MLLGPPHRAFLPTQPREEEGIQGILDYIEGLSAALNNYFPLIIGRSNHLIGMRGISGTGSTAQNLRGVVAVAPGATSAQVTFPNLEADTSYMLWLTPTGSPPLSTSYINPSTSGFLALASAGAPTGMTINWLLLR